MGLYGDFGKMLSPQKAAAIQSLLKKNACLDVVLILKRHQSLEKMNSVHLVKWGYEIEGHFLKINQKEQLSFCFQSFQQQKGRTPFPMLPQYGSWMFQIVPIEAFTNSSDLTKIVTQLKNIYQYFEKSGRMILTIPNIPFYGANKGKNENNQVTQSLYIDDRHMVDHTRVRAITKNIMARRMSKMVVNAPLFFDQKTEKEEISETEPDPNFIFMDSNAYGPGMACLQCTFSTENLYNTQFIYDQMHIISPLMLAITAGTPFFKGKVSNWDVRWKVLEDASDCRNNEERDKKSKVYTPNSRYSPSRLFICPNKFNKKQYNDMEARIDPELKELIKRFGDEKQVSINDFFLDHLANIVSRDLLYVTQDIKKMIGESQTLFDTFNCSNMPSVRLKTPTGSSIGWRAQLRTMQVQLTGQQNAAFSLLTYFFNYFILENINKINLYLPMSLVHQNFQRALANDALIKQKFFFRTNINEAGEPAIEQLYIKQIFLGYEKEGKRFIGVFNLVKEFFLNSTEDNDKFKKIVEQVFKFLEEKVSGQRITLAQWMRAYVKKHSDYKSNSILAKSTMDDMLKILHQISKGNHKEKNFRPIFSL